MGGTLHLVVVCSDLYPVWPAAVEEDRRHARRRRLDAIPIGSGQGGDNAFVCLQEDDDIDARKVGA